MKWKQLFWYCHLTVQGQIARAGCCVSDVQNNNPKEWMLSKFQGPSLNQNPNEQGKNARSHSPTQRLRLFRPAVWRGGSGCPGTVDPQKVQRTECDMEDTCMQWQTISQRCQDKTSGLAGQGWGVVTLFPGLAFAAKGVHDAAGTLLSILSTLILSTALFFIF